MNTMVTGVRILQQRGVERSGETRFVVPSSTGGWKEITWGDFLEYTTRIALYLADAGMGRDSKVSILAKTRVEWAYCGAAIQACRGVLVPVYHSNTPPQIGYILNNSDVEILMTEVDLLPRIFSIWGELTNVNKIILFDALDEDGLVNQIDRFNRTYKKSLNIADVQGKLLSLDDVHRIGAALKKESPEGFDRLVGEIGGEDVSAILYTSGTTGDPKGVVLTNDNLDKNAEDWIEVLGPLIPENRVDLLWLPTSHIFGLGELGLGNTLGFKTYFTTPADVLNLMPEVKPTIFMSVPAYWEKLYGQAKEDAESRGGQIERLLQLTGGSLKFCLSGGAGLKKEVKTFFYAAGLLIIEGYGLTECSPTLTMNSKDDFDFDSVGKPFPRTSLRLAPDGEILAKGPNIFQGYYRDPVATAEVFTGDGWFKTGDLGEWTEEGFLRIRGRKKEIIVTSGGKNISPQLIESGFKDDPYIDQLVLYGDEKKYLVALVTLKEEAICAYARRRQLSWDSYGALLKNPGILSLVQGSVERVNQGLASFETIKRFYIHDAPLTVAEGHLTPSLKLRRNRIYELFKERLEALYAGG
ncbi:MAG: long-chain fatty acid--CoA ligase [Gammaproteobacteria bacterium]|nr:long-chain fatty acid--CoA ligase [Gammaproteobacteria bacterium]